MDEIEGERVLTLRSRSHEEARVVVEDQGHGISAAAGERLFEPFFTTKSEGMGMGLAICRSIVGAYGGHLWFARAQVGIGTIFHFMLPES
jgi:signal transduction histidine kinase